MREVHGEVAAEQGKDGAHVKIDDIPLTAPVTQAEFDVYKNEVLTCGNVSMRKPAATPLRHWSEGRVE